MIAELLAGVLLCSDTARNSGWQNIAEFGARPDATDVSGTDNTGALRAMVSALGPTPTTVVIPGRTRADGEVTFPETLTIRFEGGGALDVGPHGHVTILGPIEAGSHQIFFGRGIKTLGPLSQGANLLPSWWGAKGNGVNDDTEAFQAALDSTPSGGVVLVTPGLYKITSTLYMTGRGQVLRGSGILVTELLWGGMPGGWLIENNYRENTIEFISLNGRNKNGNGIRNRATPRPTTKTNKGALYERLWLRGFATAVSFEPGAGGGLTQADGAAFYNTLFSDSGVCLLIDTCDADYVSVYSSEFSGCSQAAVRVTWGGELSVTGGIFATNFKDIEVPAGSKGAENITLRFIQGESQGSRVMIDLAATVRNVLLESSILNGEVRVASGGSFVSINNFYHQGDLVATGSNQQIFELGDKFLHASYRDLGKNNRRFNIDGSGLNLLGNEIFVRPVVPSLTPLTIRAQPSQAADLVRIEGATGATMLAIDKNGALSVPQTLIVRSQDPTTGASLSVVPASAAAPTASLVLYGSSETARAPYLAIQHSGSEARIASLGDAGTSRDIVLDRAGVEVVRLGSAGLRIYGGAPITGHLSGTARWSPPPMGAGALASGTVRIPGAAVGDTVAVGFSRPVPSGALLVGAVTAGDMVSVTLLNMTGSALDLGAGMLRADVWKH